MSYNSEYLIGRISLHCNKLSKDCPVAIRLKERMYHLIEGLEKCHHFLREKWIDTILKDVKRLHDIVKQQQPKQLFASTHTSGKDVVAKHVRYQGQEALCRDTVAFLEDLKNINQLRPVSYRYGKIAVLVNEPTPNFSDNSAQEPIERLSSPRCGKPT